MQVIHPILANLRQFPRYFSMPPITLASHKSTMKLVRLRITRDTAAGGDRK